jgi:hypothetical protein
MCLDIVSLILQTKDAIVVDFQDPTAQVTKRSQFFFLIKSNNFSGNHNSSNKGIFVLIGLNTAQNQFFDINTFTLNLEYHFKSIEKSNSKFSSNTFFCLSFIIELISFFSSSVEKTSYSSK